MPSNYSGEDVGMSWIEMQEKGLPGRLRFSFI